MRSSLLALAALLAAAPACAQGSDVGRRFPPERSSIVDRVTGVPIAAVAGAR